MYVGMLVCRYIGLQICLYVGTIYKYNTGFMLFLVSAPLKLSQVGVPWGSLYKGYI